MVALDSTLAAPQDRGDRRKREGARLRPVWLPRGVDRRNRASVYHRLELYPQPDLRQGV